MKSELKVFGLRLNMAPRANRRLLVATLYGALALLIVWSWIINPNGSGGAFWAIESGIFFGPILGGVFYGKYFLFGSGLVEPFDGNEIIDRRQRSKLARVFYPVDDEREILNDERGLVSRDRSHFTAFRFLGGLVSLAFLLKFAESSHLDIGLSFATMDHIVYGLLQISWVCFMTLPQAILLWTEPDMEDE